MSEEKKKLTEEERKALKEKMKKQIDEMSDEELDNAAGGRISKNKQYCPNCNKFFDTIASCCPDCGARLVDKTYTIYYE